jgi:hypothetical protein
MVILLKKKKKENEKEKVMVIFLPRHTQCRPLHASYHVCSVKSTFSHLLVLKVNVHYCTCDSWPVAMAGKKPIPVPKSQDSFGQ